MIKLKSLITEASGPTLEKALETELEKSLKDLIPDAATRSRVIMRCQTSVVKVLVQKKLIPF